MQQLLTFKWQLKWGHNFNIISDITETTQVLLENRVGSWDYSSITIRPSGDVREINADITEPILYVAGSNIVIEEE